MHASTLWCIGEGLDSDEIRREALARADDRLDASQLFIGTPELVERVEDAARLAGRRRLAQPRRRVLRRRRVAPADRDARARPAGARERVPRVDRGACGAERRPARAGAGPPAAPGALRSRGSRNGARLRLPCSGRMRCTFDCTMRCAIVGSGLAALATYATLRHGGVRPEEIAVFGTHDDPTEVWRDARRVDPAAAHALRVGRPPRGRGVPGPRGPRGRARADAGAARRDASTNRYHPTRRGLPAARRVGARGERLGAELPPRADRAHHAGRRRVRRRRRDVPRMCSSRPVIPGLAQPAEYAGAVHAYEPHDYASKVAVVGAGHGRRDRMAERARRRQRGRLDPPPRAAAARAQRAARVLLEARPRRVPRFERRAPRGDAARALDAVLSARPRVGRADRARAADGRVPRRQTEPTRGRAGDLRDRLPQGLARGPAARATWSRRTSLDDARTLDRARARLDRARRSPTTTRTLSLAGVAGAVGVSGRRHDRRREVRRTRIPEARMSYTLKGRIESRLAAALPVLVLAFALHRWWAIELVALMLAIGLALDSRLRPRARLSAGLARVAARRARARPRLRGDAGARDHGAAPLGARCSTRSAGSAARSSAHALFPRFRLEYAEAGGELGRAGAVTAVAVVAVALGGVGAAYASARRPCTCTARCRGRS